MNQLMQRDFFEVPLIDEEKLLLVYSVLKESGMPFSKLKGYVETTMLVQLALDTHDMVTLSLKEDDEEKLKHRQLTVLAGDYYSGLYYYLLAQLEDIEMIKLLASAIKKINEEKISIYHEEFKLEQTQHFITKVKNIEALLIQKLADYVHLPAFKQVAEQICLLKRLVKEKNELFIKGYSSIPLGQFESKFMKKKESIEIFEAYIIQTKESIEKLMNSHFKTHHLLQECFARVIQTAGLSKEKIVEEG
jgi:heptaprenyl diphosphate synthase